MTLERNNEIAKLYASGSVLTSDIAKQFSLSVKQVQRIVKSLNVSRTRAESNLLLAPLKDYSGMKASPMVKKLRKLVSEETRGMMLRNFPECSVCGIKRFHGTRLEVFGNAVVCVKCLQKNKTKLY